MPRPDPDRRRFLLATIVTLLALPALWWVNQSGESGAPNVASVGVDVGGNAANPDSGASTATDESVPNEPVFLDGPSRGNAGVAEIAVPAPPEREPVIGTGSYSSRVASVGQCLVRGVEPWNNVTIVNLDNNRSTTCVAAPAPETQTTDVVLHTRAYNKLADLTDAPIPVEIRP